MTVRRFIWGEGVSLSLSLSLSLSPSPPPRLFSLSSLSFSYLPRDDRLEDDDDQERIAKAALERQLPVPGEEGEEEGEETQY